MNKWTHQSINNTRNCKWQIHWESLDRRAYRRLGRNLSFSWLQRVGIPQQRDRTMCFTWGPRWRWLHRQPGSCCVSGSRVPSKLAAAGPRWNSSPPLLAVSADRWEALPRPLSAEPGNADKKRGSQNGLGDRETQRAAGERVFTSSSTLHSAWSSCSLNGSKFLRSDPLKSTGSWNEVRETTD